MKIKVFILLMPMLAATSGFAQEFKCEHIKEKKVRDSCVAERSKSAKKTENAQDAFVKQAKMTIAQTLKDPGSATFSKLKYLENPERRSQALCGDMNAKNSYGGFVGSKPFLSLLAPREEGGSPVWTTWAMQVPEAGNMKNIQKEIELIKLAMSYCEDNAAKVTSIAE